MTLDIFYVLVFHPYIFYGEVSGQVIYPVLSWVVCFLVVEFGRLFIYSRYTSFTGYVVCKYFLPFCIFSYHLKMFFCRTKVFNFWSIIYSFFPLWIMILVLSKNCLSLDPKDFLIFFYNFIFKFVIYFKSIFV